MRVLVCVRAGKLISGSTDDRLTTKDYDETWNEWANEIQPVAALKAYMAMPGNHEATCHSFGDFFCPDGLKNFSAYARVCHCLMFLFCSFGG